MTLKVPADRKYSPEHQWALADADGSIRVGITDYAQELLGDLVFVQSPESGRQLKQGEQCGVVESVKSASDIYSPLSGRVTAVNKDLDTAPEKINQDAYGNWIFKLIPADAAEQATLLDSVAYEQLTQT